MNLLKPLFIFVAPVLLILIVVEGVLIGLENNNLILAAGVIFSALPLGIDEKGVIIHSDQTTNYRVKPEPKELLGVFAL